ncbi:zinc-ribbon domain-containing protein [Clostridium sp. UBA6640]|uniref:zinc-ribbon domain-containing protein n=1 Tax=Clostridium sp. UBA6640 TaxID=1946370 RepID=UPI0025C6A1C7|nr:zinc-ribbon domain-containing protein [Clostridium sp. UBA6640]
MYCSQCGKEVQQHVKFCPNCGKEILGDNANINNEISHLKDETNYDYSANMNNSIGDNFNRVSEDELRTFIGEKNTNYYIEKWNLIDQTNKSVSWNWASFFLGSLWLLYRKMYVWGALMIAVSMVISWMGMPFGWLLLGILVGMFGNKLYLEETRKKIIEIKATTSDLNGQHQMIKSKGGTNLALPIVIAVIGSLITIFLIIIGIAAIGLLYM